MSKRLRNHQFKSVVPLIAVCLLLCALALVLSGFGVVYLFQTPVSIDELGGEGLRDGAYAFVDVAKLDGTYARFGPDVAEGEEPEFIERYCVYSFGADLYIGVRVKAAHFSAIAESETARTTFGEEAARAMDFGRLTGTLHRADEEIHGFLRTWAERSGVGADAGETPSLSVPSGGGSEVAGEIALQTYLDRHVLPYILEVDYLGSRTGSEVWIFSVLALLFLLGAAALAVLTARGVWEKSVRAQRKADGRAALEADFARGRAFAKTLHIGHTYIWRFAPFKTELLKTADVIWAYPRSKRLEGGKLTWSIVLRTEDKREYAALLGPPALVQAAIDELKAQGYLLTTGYDKERQKLYDKSVSDFKAAIKREKQEKQES